MQRYDPYHLEKAETLSEFLQSEFLRRLKRNSQYSLRAFARDLGMSPGRLSEVLNGKRGMSQRSLATISASLKIKKSHQDIINDLFFIQSSKSEKIKENARSRLVTFRERSQIARFDKEKFRLISEWYHAAIIELTETRGFQRDPKWIAQRLGISATQAETALSRLLEFGLIVEKDGVLSSGPNISMTQSETSFEAIQHHHRQMLQKALNSIPADPPELRVINSMILAIPTDHLPEFRKEIQNFLQSFWKKIEKTPKDELYALNIQFIPITKPARGKPLAPKSNA